MRHCSSVVDVDTRRSFEGPFSETAWSTVHCWRRSRRLALATVNLGASECNTSLRWDVTSDSIPNISPPDVLPTLGRQTWYAPSMGTCSPRVSACFSAVRLTRLRRNENRGDDGHSKMQELGQIGLDAAVDGGQSKAMATPVSPTAPYRGVPGHTGDGSTDGRPAWAQFTCLLSPR